MPEAALYRHAMDIRIGTSGYHYKHWIGRYYPEDMKAAGMLAWYLRDFDTVELNNTFYHLPKESAFDSWRNAVPVDFLYAVKGSRFITHMIKLKDPGRGIWNFVPRAQRLGRKLGPILWQLPPGWNVNVERLEQFLEELPRGIRYAFELRNQSWMIDQVYDVLRKHDAAFPAAGSAASRRRRSARALELRIVRTALAALALSMACPCIAAEIVVARNDEASFRQALQTANVTPGPSRITFASSTGTIRL